MRIKIITSIISIAFGSFLTAQDFAPRFISFTGGKQFTNFVFKNSQDQKDQSLEYQMYNSFGVNAEFTNKKHTIRPDLQLRQALRQLFLRLP